MYDMYNCPPEVLAAVNTMFSSTGQVHGTPVIIPHGNIFLVPNNTQVMYSVPINNEGIIEVDGYLVEVA